MTRLTDWIDMHPALTCQVCGVIVVIVLAILALLIWDQWKAQQRFNQMRNTNRQ